MNYTIAVYETIRGIPALDELQEAVVNSKLRYSLRHVLLTGAATAGDLHSALQKSMEVCSLGGLNSKEHFKPVYVFDAGTGGTHTDWLMSKKGFCLMMMNLPLNEQTARWLCELAGE
ncbi:MAG TPA: hypothetical protein VK174_10620 [Chitinophagales bacterium]|nr:hypothetical protein [Chitinophagales bacterium]